MSIATTTSFRREVLESDKSQQAARLMQGNLATLVDLALVLKQAHWNVVGPNFRSLHLQLDEIIETVRAASDGIAERIVTIGQIPDGRSSTVASATVLDAYLEGLNSVAISLTAVADRMKTAIDQLRASIDVMGGVDPVSEDLLISVAAQLEKHLWMVQAQEIS